MRFVIQRVTQSSVSVDGTVIGKIGKGLLVLIGVAEEDTEETADKLVRKLTGLRVFEDENGKTNLSLADVKGELLLISQFTLYANCKRETAPALRRQVLPKRRMRFMSISSQNAVKTYRLWRLAASERK